MCLRWNFVKIKVFLVSNLWDTAVSSENLDVVFLVFWEFLGASLTLSSSVAMFIAKHSFASVFDLEAEEIPRDFFSGIARNYLYRQNCKVIFLPTSALLLTSALDYIQ